VTTGRFNPQSRTSSIADRFLATLLLLCLWLSASLGLAQSQPPAPPAPPAAQAPSVPKQAPAPQSPTTSAQPAPEHHISPEEAKKLLDSVDEVVKFDSDDTKLPLRRPIKRQLISRGEVEKYVQDHLRDDKDAQRLERAEVVLKRFGLLPREFDTRSFMVKLLAEQVAGYYDDKTKTVNLLDWLPLEDQLPVMAHELTHALQDQNFDLEKWSDGLDSTDGKDPQTDVESDEQSAARHAVVEGQAMAAMLDYELAPVGTSLAKSKPDFAKAVEAGMADSPDSPVFNQAPLYLKQVLLFPYTYGLDFERELLVRGGPELAFAGVFKNPPISTHQVMHPETYFAGERIPPLKVADFAKILGRDFELYDVGSIGELDVTILIRQFAGADVADRLGPKWRGGYYYAAKKKGSPRDQVALAYVSRWTTAEAANKFIDFYASALASRYDVTADSSSAEVSTKPKLGMRAGLSWLSWETSGGTIFAATDGDIAVTLEGFEEAIAPRLLQTAIDVARRESPPPKPADAK